VFHFWQLLFSQKIESRLFHISGESLTNKINLIHYLILTTILTLTSNRTPSTNRNLQIKYAQKNIVYRIFLS